MNYSRINYCLLKARFVPFVAIGRWGWDGVACGAYPFRSAGPWGPQRVKSTPRRPGRLQLGHGKGRLLLS